MAIPPSPAIEFRSIKGALIAAVCLAVVIGGFVGASFGSKHLGHHGLRKILGIVLLIASIKMFLTAPSTIITPLENSGTLSP